jgi:hypothetical protein
VRRLLSLGLVAVAAAGCGSSSHVSAPATTTTVRTVPVSPAPTTLTVFKIENGALRAVVAHVPHTTAVAASALGAIGLAAPVTIAGGTATVSLDHATNEQLASIVYTLTRYPAVQRVDVAGRTGLTRADFATYLAPIAVESPGDGAEVPATFSVSGTASVFEATLVVQFARDGHVLQKRTVTASEGAPGRGTFSTTLTVDTPGAGTVAAFSPSAADGTPQHEVDVPVTVKP